MILASLLLFLSFYTTSTWAFSAPIDSSFTLFDRFRPKCPASSDSIRRFDNSLITKDDKETTWVAVYRQYNNKPSVFVKDEFLNAMRLATGATEVSSAASPLLESSTEQGTETPVAVARLRPSDDYPDTWVMDTMRCMLMKEETDEACDGGSEYNEALCVAIDALLLHHLKHQDRFEGSIRTKATIFSSKLLEERGFREVESLSKDMATHVSSLDACMDRFAERAVSTVAKNPGARDRAIQILSHLGRLDRDSELQAAEENSDDGDDDDYDPWKTFSQSINL